MGGRSLTDALAPADSAEGSPGKTTRVERELGRIQGPQPLPDPLRARIEGMTGEPLGDVRLHTGPDAAAVAASHAARAVAIGQDIYVGEDEALDGVAGEELIAHEVAHTIQDRKSARAHVPATKRTTAIDSPAELEADRFADAVTAGRTPAAVVEPLDGAVARDAIVTSNDHKPAAPVDQFTGPVTWAVVGDTFQVDLARENGELVADITYAGANPVDSYQALGEVKPQRKRRIKIYRRAPDGRKDLPFNTKVIARTADALTYDLFGDGIEQLKIHDQVDAGDYNNFDRRKHMFGAAINAFPSDPLWFEVHLPTVDGKQHDGDPEAIVTHKLKLLDDEVTLRARRHGDSDNLVLNVLFRNGEQQVLVPRASGAAGKLAIAVLSNDGRTIAIDLDADGKADATFVHTMRQFPPPSAYGRHGMMDPGMDWDFGDGRDRVHHDSSPYYVHEVATYNPAGALLGTMIQKMPGYPGGIPPEQDAVKQPAPAGQAPVGQGPQQDDNPLEPTAAKQNKGRDWELRVDGDGDRTKELLFNFIPKTPGKYGDVQEFTLRITQISSGAAGEISFFLMPQLADTLNLFGPRLMRSPDGLSPGQIDVGGGAGAPLLFGKKFDQTGVADGHVRYQLQIADRYIHFDPPTEPTPGAFKDPGATPPPTKKVADILTTEIPLSEYQDKFRVTAEPMGWNDVLFGVSAIQDGQQMGGIHARVQDLEAGRLEVEKLTLGQADLGIDLEKKVGPLHITSAIDPAKDPDSRRAIEGVPLASHRDHRVTMWANRGGQKFEGTFPVRYGKFIQAGWEKGKDSHQAAGSADAVSVIQEQAKHPSLSEYRAQIDASLDSAFLHAVEKKYITQDAADQWMKLRAAMILISAAAENATVPRTQEVGDAQSALMIVDGWIASATNKAENLRIDHPNQRPAPGESSMQLATNIYTGATFETYDRVMADQAKNSTTYGQRCGDALEVKNWPGAILSYNSFRNGVRDWIKELYKRDTPKGEPQSPEAAQLDYASKQAEQVDKLDQVQKQTLALDNAIDKEVLAAADKGLLPANVKTVWSALRDDMVSLVGQASADKADKDLTQQAVDHTNLLSTWLAADTKDETQTGVNLKFNSYTGAQEMNTIDDTIMTPSFAAKLVANLQANQLLQAGQAYNHLRDGVVRWIAQKYRTQLHDPIAAFRLQQLQISRARRREMIRVPVLYQADDEFAEQGDSPDGGYKRADFGKYKTIPLTVFVWAEDGKWRIKDITNPDHVWAPEDGVDFKDGEDQPPAALFKLLDHDKHLPKGYLTYQLPDGTGARMRMESKKKWYEYVRQWAMVVGLAALALLIIAGTMGAGTEVAIPVFIAGTAAALASVTADIGELYDNSRNHFLDSTGVFMDCLDIAVNIVALGAAGAGKLAMGAEAAALAEAEGTGQAYRGMAAVAGKIGSMLYRPLMATMIAGNVLNTVVMSAEMWDQLAEADKIPDPHERLKVKAQLLAMWAVSGAMVIFSLHGDLPALKEGAPTIVLDNVNGRMVARVGDVHVGQTRVHVQGEKPNAVAGARWQAEELEFAARQGKGNAGAAMDDGEFREWYAKWLETPGDRFTPDGKVIVPENTPAGYKERLEGLVGKGDGALHQQALKTADEVETIRQAAKDGHLEMDPSNKEEWKASREKLELALEDKLGSKTKAQAAIARYEAARAGAGGNSADFLAQRAKINQVVPETEITRIKGLYPGREVHVTGDLTSPQAAAGKGTNAVEIAVIVPNDTTPEVMFAMEQRASGYKVLPDPEFTKTTGRETLELRVKVMTEDQFFGMATASRSGKAAPQYVRVDQEIHTAVDFGVEVHEQSPTRYTTDADKIAQARDHMMNKPEHDGRVGKYRYDPDTNTVSFEVEGSKAGNKIRVEAALPPRITTVEDMAAKPNRIVGKPVKHAEGLEILRKVNDGNLSALDATGVHVGEAKLPPETEFGLGELPNGDVVIIRGEGRAVDWKDFPGVKPLAHTHPDVKGVHTGNDLSKPKMSVGELGTLTPDGTPNIDAGKVMPTAEDLAVMLARKMEGHRVLTPFHEKGGWVFKPDENNVGKPLDWVIGKVEEVGTLPSGERVYKATITAEAGGERVVSREVWGTVDPEGFNSNVNLREPAGMIPIEHAAPSKPPTTTRSAAAPKVPPIDAKEIGTAEIARQGVTAKVDFPPPLTPDEFTNKFGSEKGRAVFVIEKNGDVKIYTTTEARKIDVIAEVYHAKQLQDPVMGAEIRRLHAPDLAKNWETMSAADRLEVFRRKLAIEIDAHEGMLGELRGADRQEIAGQLRDLKKLQRRAEALGATELAEMNAGVRKMEPYLDDPAWLFNKKRGGVSAAHEDAVLPPKDEQGAMRLPDEGPERSAAYSNLKGVKKVSQIGAEWQEHWQITTGYEGKVTKVTPNAKGGTTIELTDDSGAVHTYDLAKGSEVVVEVDPNKTIHKGELLGNEPPRRYRLVEIEFEGKPSDRRQEIRKWDEDYWVQRGSESTDRGEAMELAARAQVDDQLAATQKAKVAKGQYFDYHRLEYSQGSGGFDDVIVQFTGSVEKPKAKIRIREVKDYPDRHVPLADFTAILGDAGEVKGNLVQNKNRLNEVVGEEMRRLANDPAASPSGPFKDMTRDQVFAVGDALKKNNVDIEIVLSGDTLLGREGDPGSSVITKLRKSVKAAFDGEDVLKTRGGKYSPERVKQEYADKFKKPAADVPDGDEP